MIIIYFICSSVYVWRRQWHTLQYSRLENPRDRGAWWAAVCGVAQSRMQVKRLSSSSVQVSSSLPVYPCLTLTADIHVFVCLFVPVFEIGS